MSNTAKIAFSVVLIVIAIGIAVWQYQIRQPHETGHLDLPPGSSPKVQAMKAMREGKQPGAQGTPNGIGPQ